MRGLESTGLLLRKLTPPVPFRSLLAAWQHAQLDRRTCHDVLARTIAHRGGLAPFFRAEEILHGGRAATDALLFDFFVGPRPWVFLAETRAGAGKRAGAQVPDQAVPAIVDVLCAARDGAPLEDLRARAQQCMTPALAALLCAAVAGAPGDATAHGAWPAPRHPGIYRREHASLLIRSRTTSVLVDPQSLNLGWTTNESRYPVDPEPLQLDAIAITHQHEDHWHLPTLLWLAARRDIELLIPEVPAPSLLTPEVFAESAAHVGCAPRVVKWGDTVQVGDIHIEALPFYGEQPTQVAPGAGPGLRSHGNCYRFDTPELSALVLVDSGADPAGSMIDAIRDHVGRRGPVDVVLANCRPFPEALNPGLPEYAFVLPFERLEQAHRERIAGRVRSITLGPEGVARACQAAGARYFLPYAHGFHGLGVDVDAAMNDALHTAWRDQGVEAELVAWNPGDCARPHGRALQIVPAGA